MRNRFWTELLACIIIVSIVGAGIKNWDIDSTDTSDDERSGMSLYTDALTGCQYLGAGFGGITPRLDKDGHHVCSEGQ